MDVSLHCKNKRVSITGYVMFIEKFIERKVNEYDL